MQRVLSTRLNKNLQYICPMPWVWILKEIILVRSSFILEDAFQGNITIEGVMAQLGAMSTHFIKDWIISVWMISMIW